jgi:hypothetical protein
MSPTGIETAVQASERLQTQALDRAATGIVRHKYLLKFDITITATRLSLIQ